MTSEFGAPMSSGINFIDPLDSWFTDLSNTLSYYKMSYK